MPHATSPISRAAVVRGLAWTAPAVAAMAAAPFAAASPIVRYTLDFSTGRATAPGTPVPPVLPVAVTSSPTGGLTRTPAQLTVSGARTVIIDFGREVTNVTFTLADIDWYDNSGASGVHEYVAVSPAPSPTRTVPSGVTSTSPFSAATQDTTGSVAVTIDGPVRTVTLQLTNTGRGKATPDVLVQNLQFTVDLKTQ